MPQEATPVVNLFMYGGALAVLTVLMIMATRGDIQFKVTVERLVSALTARFERAEKQVDVLVVITER